MYCRNCGQELNENEKYCNECGTRISKYGSPVNRTKHIKAIPHKDVAIKAKI